MITRRESDNAARAGEHFVRIDSLVSVPFEVSHFTMILRRKPPLERCRIVRWIGRRHATIVEPEFARAVESLVSRGSRTRARRVKLVQHVVRYFLH